LVENPAVGLPEGIIADCANQNWAGTKASQSDGLITSLAAGELAKLPAKKSFARLDKAR
jgi:hypothetical protein